MLHPNYTSKTMFMEFGACEGNSARVRRNRKYVCITRKPIGLLRKRTGSILT